jgi:hypothetical protein
MRSKDTWDRQCHEERRQNYYGKVRITVYNNYEKCEPTHMSMNAIY